MQSAKRVPSYAVSEINSILKGSTNKFGWLQAPATKLTDSQRLVGLHRQAFLLFVKDLGKKSLSPCQSQAIHCRKVNQFFLPRSVHHQ
jgi:hypothetical protein